MTHRMTGPTAIRRRRTAGLDAIPPAYPMFFAVVPAISIASANVGQFAVSDLVRVVAAITACTLAALLLAWGVALARPGVREAARAEAVQFASAMVMLAVVWCFYYEPIRAATKHVSWRLSRPPAVIAAGAVVTLLAMWWVIRRRRDLAGLTRMLTAFGALLLAVSVARLIGARSRAPGEVRHSRLVAALAAPIRTVAPVSARRNTPKRDIYLIIADMHANSAVLSRYLHFGNSRFEDSLRALGFVVPRDMRSNYVETVLSVPSLLNFSQVTRLEQDVGARSADYTVPKYLAENNRLVRFLQAQHYRFLFFPSAWFPLTQHNPHADSTVDVSVDRGMIAAMRRTELRRAVLESTLLSNLAAPSPADWRHVPRTLHALESVPEDTAPTLAFAHLMSPHPPYLVDAACRPLEHEIGDVGSVGLREERAPYVAQLECLDRQLLQLVSALRAKSHPQPIIIIVGDHGSRFTDPYYYSHANRVSPEFVRERFGAFGAFYLPAGGDSVFARRTTLVNVLRNVLRYYFGADLPPVPNAQYVSGEHPYSFVPVDTLTGRLIPRRIARAAP